MLAFALLLCCLQIVLSELLFGICQKTQWNSCIRCGCSASIQLLNAIAFKTICDFFGKFFRLVLEFTRELFADRDLAFLFFHSWVHGEAPWLLEGLIRISAEVVVSQAVLLAWLDV